MCAVPPPSLLLIDRDARDCTAVEAGNFTVLRTGNLTSHLDDSFPFTPLSDCDDAFLSFHL